MAQRDHLTTGVTPTAASMGASGAAMERSADEIRQNIAATRDAITETVDELSSRMQRTLDWKSYVADYPLITAEAADGVGLMLGYFFRRRETPGERIKAAVADLLEDTTHRVQEQFDNVGWQRPGMQQTLLSLATSACIKLATDYARHKFTTQQESDMLPEENYADNPAYRYSRTY